MARITVVILLLCSVALSGCLLKRDRPVLYGQQQVIINRVVNYYVKGDLSGYKGYTADSVALRNAVINDLLIVSDSNEKIWRTTVKTDINTRQLALDFAGIGLAGAASVVGSSLAKSLSAGSAAAQGINTAWDRRYIAEKAIDTIINAVDIERTTKKAQILESMKITDLNQYGVSDGVRDAVEYDALLTIDVGVNEIQNATSSSLDKAKTSLSSALKKP